MVPSSSGSVAIVVIGRNEGDRLKRCLPAAVKAAAMVVYVDSGSVDGSVAFARSAGCHVVEIDPAQPFSAARARNEGFAFVMEREPGAVLIQFVDGDCELADGWLVRGRAVLNERSEVGIACGHVREIRPHATVYKTLCDLEWQKTPGELSACGGIFMVRAKVFRALGGFRADVIAGEDDEFCVRVRQAGWKILLMDASMAGHDAAMSSFIEWCRRAMRTGHAYAQVAAIHGKSEERYFVPECRRIWLWGLLLPLVALCLAPFLYGLSILALIGLFALQFVRIYFGGKSRGWSSSDARVYACFTMLAKFPALAGMLAYHWRRGRGRAPTILEHKRSS
jgi:GT2 family glycosyltransferase